MCVALFNEIFRQFSLRQQGVRGDGFTGNIDRIQQRNGGFDFVRLFLFVAAFYRQSTDFFWV